MMGELKRIPMFPLTIFPLPGELVPLHIFEPRYRQLLKEAEEDKTLFGIYFNHTSNTEKLGALVELESVIKRYSGGESDVIVRCVKMFTMEKLYRTFQGKLYPAGDVSYLNMGDQENVSDKLLHLFNDYLELLSLNENVKEYSAYDIANELNLAVTDKMKFVQYEQEKKESFLLSRITYQITLLRQAEKSKDVFHLN